MGETEKMATLRSLTTKYAKRILPLLNTPKADLSFDEKKDLRTALKNLVHGDLELINFIDNQWS